MRVDVEPERIDVPAMGTRHRLDGYFVAIKCTTHRHRFFMPPFGK
jgi:hypothetical protein